MEILRDLIPIPEFKNIHSESFGTIEKLKETQSQFKHFPLVVKSWQGANSKAVYLAKTPNQLIRKSNKVSRTRQLNKDIWDIGRSLKHKGYIKDSRNRNKYIVQNFIHGLNNDWKIYVFGDSFYIFYRPILKKNKFKASGGGYENYLYGSKSPKPDGIFDFANKVFNALNIPCASLDIAFDGRQFYLLEFQAIYFGTAGILHSDCYYIYDSMNWQPVHKKLDIEYVYVHAIQYFLKNQNIE